jgi:hypothetical protein
VGARSAENDSYLIQSPQQSGLPRPRFFRPLKFYFHRGYEKCYLLLSIKF